MGEGRRTYHWGADQAPNQRRVTVSEAAEVLGISPEAVRMRIKRGTLPSEKRAGRVYVLLGHRPTSEQTTEQTPDRTAELIATLREQLQAERQDHAEARRLLAAALERIPPQLDAASQPRESPGEAPAAGETVEDTPAADVPPAAREYAVTPTPQPGRVEPQAPIEGAQEAQEFPEMAMPEAGGGPLPRDQQTASEAPRRW